MHERARRVLARSWILHAFTRAGMPTGAALDIHPHTDESGCAQWKQNINILRSAKSDVPDAVDEVPFNTKFTRNGRNGFRVRDPAAV
jgi:hypothetical protein